MKTAEIIAVARMFDDAGYDGLICSAHLIYPRELSSPYPDSPTGKHGWAPETAWPDSWVLIGAMAAVTQRLRFSNAVYVAPARPLIEVAKQVATASVLSEGRVSLGVGVALLPASAYELSSLPQPARNSPDAAIRATAVIRTGRMKTPQVV